MSSDLDAVQASVSVAEQNSFTRAAELLNSTQSAISRLTACNPPIPATTKIIPAQAR